MTLSRRRFLTGASGAALALPWLEKLSGGAAFAQAATTRPTRLLVVAYPMGFIQEEWAPSAAGATFTLPRITAPLEPFRQHLLFISNVDNRATQLNSQHAFGHPAKKESVLTGTLMRAAFQGDQSNVLANVIADRAGSDQGGPNNESVCNFVGTRIRGTRPNASIDLAVSGDQYDHHDVNSSFFFEGPVTPVKVQANPSRAFARYFANVTGDSAALEAQRRARARKKSALDAVREGYVELRSGLNAQDRTRLEDHANRIRQIELEMARATCTRPAGNYGTPTLTAPYLPFRNLSMRERAALMVPILTNAMACDLAPVGRLEFIDQQNPLFGVTSVDAAIRAWNTAPTSSDWHGMVHGDASPVDGVRTRGTPNAQYLVDSYRSSASSTCSLACAPSRKGPTAAPRSTTRWWCSARTTGTATATRRTSSASCSVETSAARARTSTSTGVAATRTSTRRPRTARTRCSTPSFAGSTCARRAALPSEISACRTSPRDRVCCPSSRDTPNFSVNVLREC